MGNNSTAIILLLAYILFFLDNFLRELLRWKNSVHTPKITADDKRSSSLMVLFLILVPLTPLIKLYQVGELEISVFQWTGIAIILSGVVIHIVAIETLGKFYSGTLTTSNGQHIIKTGLYKIVRHPGYLGNLFTGLGFGLASGNFISLSVIIVLFIIIYSYRILSEEKMLLKKFGSEYEKYTKETKRLIPFVY